MFFCNHKQYFYTKSSTLKLYLYFLRHAWSSMTYSCCTSDCPAWEIWPHPRWRYAVCSIHSPSQPWSYHSLHLKWFKRSSCWQRWLPLEGFEVCQYISVSVLIREGTWQTSIQLIGSSAFFFKLDCALFYSLWIEVRQLPLN